MWQVATPNIFLHIHAPHIHPLLFLSITPGAVSSCQVAGIAFLGSKIYEEAEIADNMIARFTNMAKYFISQGDRGKIKYEGHINNTYFEKLHNRISLLCSTWINFKGFPSFLSEKTNHNGFKVLVHVP